MVNEKVVWWKTDIDIYLGLQERLRITVEKHSLHLDKVYSQRPLQSEMTAIATHHLRQLRIFGRRSYTCTHHNRYDSTSILFEVTEVSP